MKTISLMALCGVIVLAGCTAQQKQNTKDGAKEIGTAARDVTRDAGHFFRDTSKEIFSSDGAEKEE